MYLSRKIIRFSLGLLLFVVVYHPTTKVFSQCNAKFKATPNHTDTTCEFKNQSSGGMTHYFWNFGDGSYLLDYDKINHNHKYALPGKYTVVLTVWDLDAPNPCEGTYIEEVIVGDENLENPWAFFETEIINDSTIKLKNTSMGSYDKIIWDLGDGAIIPDEDSIEHIYSIPFNPVVKLKTLETETGIIDETEQFVVINENNPGVYFNIFFVDSLTKTAIFNDSITGDITNLFWNFGDGTSSNLPSPEHTYSNPGIYTVSLTGKSSTNKLFSHSKEVIIREADEIFPLFLNFNDIENKKAYLYNKSYSTQNTSYLWSSGDGEIQNSTSTSFTYDIASNYTVSLRADNVEQTAFLSKNITVGANNNVSSAFDYLPHASNSVDFHNQTTNPNTLFYWDFGDGSKTETSQNPTHQYATSGLYTVYLRTETNGYITDFLKIINVNADQEELYCDFIFFIDNAYQKTNRPVKYKGAVSRTISKSAYTLGDGNEDTVSIDLTKAYDNPGEYEICFTVFNDNNGTSYTKCKTVLVPIGIIEPLGEIFSDIVVYPNPTTDIVTIDFRKKGEHVREVSILTIDGRIIETKTVDELEREQGKITLIDLNLKTSCYLISIKTDKNVYTKKLQIIQ